MKIKINGQDYTGFIKATVSRQFINAAGQFTFTATPLNIDINDYPVKIGDTCEIVVGDETFLTGFVETIAINRKNALTDYDVEISGRDITGDLIDSTIDAQIITESTSQTTLKNICERVISGLGIEGLGVVDNVNPTAFKVGTFVAPQVGQNAFDFLSQYAHLAQTILSTDGIGNLTIEQTGTTTIPTNLLLEMNGLNNNILSTSSNITAANQYNRYQVYSQASLMYFEFQGTKFAQDSGDLQNAVTNQTGSSTNSKIRAGRQYVFVADTPLIDNDNATAYATWENNFRKTQSFKYQVTMVGHTYDGTSIWTPNTLIKVKDDFSNIDAILLIDSVSFDESLDGGLFTTLNLVWQNAYSLTIEHNYREASANVIQVSYSDTI